MAPISGPLCSALALTAASLVGAPAGQVGAAVAGILGNLASGSIDQTARRILARLSDTSIDPTTRLPRNHDLQQASVDALRGAALALVLEVAGRQDPRRPWVDVIRKHVKSGDFGKVPLLSAFTRPELRWIESLEKVIRSDKFAAWHDALRLGEEDIRACFDKSRRDFAMILIEAFGPWARNVAGDVDVPPAFDEILQHGWTIGSNAIVVNLADTYCLFFREFLKTRPEVFRILIADELAATRSMVGDVRDAIAALDDELRPFVQEAGVLLAELGPTLKLIRDGQQELIRKQSALLLGLTALQTEVLRGNDEARAALAAVQDHVAQISGAFKRVERKLFGLPLVRPTVPRPPNSDDDLWIVQAKYRALDLVGRETEESSLWQWLHSDATVSVRLITGVAGAGKTRLGFELLWRVAREHGDDWAAGRIDSDSLRLLVNRNSPVEWTWDKPTLVLVDYARAADDALKVLLRELARRSDDADLPKFRLLLLERSQSATKEWVDSLKRIESADGGQPAGELFDPREPVALSAIEGVDLRRKLFAAALRRVAREAVPLALPDVGINEEFEAMLAQADWTSPLVPVMAALVAHKRGHVLAARALTRADLAWMLAEAELSRLASYARCSLGDGGPSRLLTHVAGLCVLCGLTSVGDLMGVARRESQALGLSWLGGEGDLARGIARAWADGNGGVAALQPDIVAEAFVVLALVRSDSLAESLDGLVRHLAAHERNVARLILQAFHNFQTYEAEVEVLGRWAEALVGQGLESREPALLSALDDAMPFNTTALRQAALAVTLSLYEAHRQEPEASEQHAVDQARLAHNLAICYSELGRREDALGPAEEAVKIRRELSQRNPDAFRADLASSLTNLAIRYSDLGRRDDALGPAEEAVKVRRELWQRNPEAFRADLANSLNILANRYSELGRREDALGPAEEAVKTYRELWQRNPEAFRADLARSLNNLASHYSDLGRRDDALGPAEEAVKIWRALSQRNPDAFRADLAISLTNLATFYSTLGRREDALGPAEEAVKIWRALSQRNPDAFRADLARSCGALGYALNSLERPRDAANALREGVEALRPTFERYPGAFSGLMISLRKVYIDACEAAGLDVDEALLDPIAAKLGSIMGDENPQRPGPTTQEGE